MHLVVRITFCRWSLFTCSDEQATDEDTPDEGDENAQLLNEMSQTLENLLRQNNATTSTKNVVNRSFFPLFFFLSIRKLPISLATENVTYHSTLP